METPKFIVRWLEKQVALRFAAGTWSEGWAAEHVASHTNSGS